MCKIKFGIDAEIEKALNLFCRDELRLSKVYWPRAFRSLSMHILETLLKKPDIWAELRTASFDVDREELQKMIDGLRSSTSQYIKFKQRRWIVHLLREVSLFRKKFGLGARLINFCGESMDWPIDIEDKDDLSSSLTDMSLRDDVKRFIWKILDEVIPPDKYCNMHYYGAVKSPKNCFPIMVEVTEDYLENIKDRIVTVSDHLRILNYDNLLPVDVVEIKGVPSRNAIVSNEEGFYTCGSPWKEGTVGGILKYGNKLMGITSGHVHRNLPTEFNGLYSDKDPSSMRFKGRRYFFFFQRNGR